jgi:hypothetical protein
MKIFSFLILLLSLTFTSCDREGCTDPNANNYDDKYENDDGTCRYDSDPFAGRWEARDSILTFGTYVADEVRTIDIRILTANQAKVKFFWRNENGTYSDTLEANSKPNTLSIPEQSFADTLTISGNFTVSRIGGIKCEYTVFNDNVSIGRRGIANKLD